MEPATPIIDAEFIAWDLETTGLHPASSQIVELGAVRFRGNGVVLDQFQRVVDPQCRIPAAAFQVHGITNAMVRGQPTLSEVLPQFLKFLGESPVLMLAHNANFDLSFLSAVLGRLRLAPPTHPTLDTCGLARKRTPLRRYNLQALGRYFGLIEFERHRALEDAVLLKDVFLRLISSPPALHRVDDLYQLSTPRQLEGVAVSPERSPDGYEELCEVIAVGGSIDMQYAGGSRPGQFRRVTPRAVLQARGTFYLSAFCHQGRCDKTFRLDRIQAISVLPSNKPS